MLKVIMLPYAGSICNAYREWREFSDDAIEIVSVDYNGRGLRAEYPDPDNWESLIHSTAEQVIENVKEDDDYIIFGHSMGARVAFDVHQRLAAMSFKSPKYVVFSGTKTLNTEEEDLLAMDEQVFVDYFVEMGGIDEEILQNKELKDMVFGYLREDIRLLNQFKQDKEYAVQNTGVIIFNGKEDNKSPAEEWNRLFGQPCIYKIFKGNHFYLFDYKYDVFNCLRDIIRHGTERYDYNHYKIS